MNVRRILCYGDSLTAGYYRYGSEFSPYGDTLAALAKLSVDAVGMSGWTTDEMVQGVDQLQNEDAVDFKADGLSRLLKSRPYGLVCLMAGTNDLGTGVPVEDIVENLSVLVNICLISSLHINVALLTVPPTGAECYSEQTRIRRAAVNSGIVDLVQKNSSRMLLIDSSCILSNPGEHPRIPTEESEVWDSDLLHLSPKGSERLGQFVFNCLISHGLLDTSHTS